jgi:cytochrome c oxidase assembly protein subunit 15
MSRNKSMAARFAWVTLGWNIAVVLWGAYVRATGSGAGCGNHWPDCNGVVLGASARSQTIIEFTHRMTSGIAFLMVIGLLLWCWRVTSKSDWARYSAALAAVLMTNEALLGAALVLLDYVSQNKSAGRILVLCLHFGNTLLLLASLSLTAAWLSNGAGGFKLVRSRRQAIAIGIGLLATMAIGITGAIAALADTLFPATSLRLSLLQDLSVNAPPLLHFRMLHPLVAITSAGYIGWVIFISARQQNFSRRAKLLIILLFAQLAIGATNVLLLAPVWLQIIHLFMADVLWITLVLVSADLMLSSEERSYASVTLSANNSGR